MANEIDLIMDMDPLELAAAPPEIFDKLIAYHRKGRQNAELGIKPKKGEKGTVEVDMVKLGILKAPEPLKRRV